MAGFKWIHGSTVKDGELRFVSVSSLQKADPSSESGCPRAWAYQYIQGKKEPPSKAMEHGTKMHAEVANYLITGQKNLSTQILSNLHMVPEPVKYDENGRPDMFVEHDVVPQMEDGSSGLHLSPLTVAGVPMVGAIDLMHGRLTNKGAMDIEDTNDPPGTVEVIDWKFVSKMDWAKQPHELIETIQMAGYARYVFAVTPAKLVRISHGYMPARGLGRKHTALVDQEQVEKSWEHPTRIANMLKDVVKEVNVDLVEANTRACRSYGRDCIHKPYCKAGNHNSLDTVFDFGNTSTPDTGIPVMNLLAHIKAKKAAEPTPDAEKVNHAIGKLALEEAAAKGTSIADICAQIRAVGLGFPTLTGSAAAAYTASGLEIVGSADGEIAHVVIDDANKLPSVLADAQSIMAQREALANPSAILPPDAPESGVVVPTPQADAGEALAAIAEPKKKGKKKTQELVEATPAPAPVQVTPAPVQVNTPVTSPLVVYIDAIPTCAYRSLWDIVHNLTKLMNDKAGGDFRLTDNDPKLKEIFGFGKWRGILATLVREAVNKEVSGGHWVLDGAQGEIGQVVTDTLREVVTLRGGVMVRGVR